MTTTETLARVKELHKLIGKFLNELESEITGAANTEQSLQLSKAQRIVIRVAGYYMITTSEIYSKCREQRIVRARQVAMAILYDEKYTPKTIYKLFSKAISSSSVVCYSYEVVLNLFTTQGDYAADVKRLREQLRAEGLIK